MQGRACLATRSQLSHLLLSHLTYLPRLEFVSRLRNLKAEIAAIIDQETLPKHLHSVDYYLRVSEEKYKNTLTGASAKTWSAQSFILAEHVYRMGFGFEDLI